MIRRAASPRLFRLAVAQAVSMAGDRVHQLALVALLATRAAAHEAPLEPLLFWLGAAVFLPGLVLGPFLGPWLDRCAPARVMAWVDTLRTPLVFLLPALLLVASLPLCFAALFGFFALNALFLPARGALPPQLVPRAQLACANALLVATAVLAIVAAMAGGGYLVDRIGWAAALRLDAATYAVSALLLWSLTRTGSATARSAEGGARPVAARVGLWRTVRDLWQSARARESCAAWSLLWGLGGVLQVAGVGKIVGTSGGVGALGVLAATAALGALVGAAAARRGALGRRRGAGSMAGLALGGGSLALGLSGNPLLWGGALAGMGAAGAYLAAASETALQRAVPEGRRASAYAVREAAARLSFLAGAALSWSVIPIGGSDGALLAGGGLAALYALSRSLPRAAARRASSWEPAPAATDSAG